MQLAAVALAVSAMRGVRGAGGEAVTSYTSCPPRPISPPRRKVRECSITAFSPRSLRIRDSASFSESA